MKRDIASLTAEFTAKKDKGVFMRPDVFVDLWRCLTKIRLLARLEQTPPASGVLDLANSIGVQPEKIINLANVGEWIQVDRDTRYWNDPDEYEEYWLCHYDGNQTVEGFSSLRKDVHEIKELNKLWTD